MKPALSVLLLAGTLFSFSAAAEVNPDEAPLFVIDLNDPDNASRTMWTVPQGTNVTVVGSRAARSRQIRIFGARDVSVAGGVWSPTIQNHDGSTHTLAVRGSNVGGFSDDDPSGLERNVGRVDRNVSNTDEQVMRELMQGESQAWRRIDDIISGDAFTDGANQLINRGTRTVTDAIDDTIDGATDAVLDPIEDTIDGYVDSAVEAVQCNFAGAALAAAGGAVSSIWGGGDATYGAQLAQWLTQTAGNFCQGKQLAVAAQQLKVQRRQRDLQKRMVQRLNASAVTPAPFIEEHSMGVLGSKDEALYGAGQDEIIWDRYQSGLPQGWDYSTSAQYTQQLREQTNLASQEAAMTAVASQQSIAAALMMAEKAQAISMKSRGQTQAVQAQTQMMRSQITIDAARQAADTAFSTANLRIAEEQRAQEVSATQKIDRFYGPGELDRDAQPRRALFQ